MEFHFNIKENIIFFVNLTQNRRIPVEARQFEEINKKNKEIETLESREFLFEIMIEI